MLDPNAACNVQVTCCNPRRSFGIQNSKYCICDGKVSWVHSFLSPAFFFTTATAHIGLHDYTTRTKGPRGQVRGVGLSSYRDGDGSAADGADRRPGEPPVDAGGVERVRAGRHRAPPLPGARGLEAHGARARARARGGGAGGLVVTVAVGARGGGVGGEGEGRKAADVGGREPRAERLRRRRRGGRVERRDAVAAAAAVAGCARGEDEDEEE